MTLLEKCISVWPELDWEDIHYDDDDADPWFVGHCGCGVDVHVKPTSIQINWHGGLSFHKTLEDAKLEYQAHARKVVESAGLFLSEVICVKTAAMEGRR